VAEIDGTVVGYIMTRIDRGGILPQPFSREFGKVKGHVISLAVMPHARRRGIAESLMREAIQNIRSRGVKEVYLEGRVNKN
ncbi:MAG: ribosomal-protein-alanine acetyltransferase, partial [Thermoprotei archaeon]